MFKQIIHKQPQIRNFGFGKKKIKKSAQCTAAATQPPSTLKKDKKSFWRNGTNGSKKETKPPIECCRLKQARDENLPDPDLSEFNGQVYKTSGTAFIIQKDKIPTIINSNLTNQENEENKLLKLIEIDESLKTINKPLLDIMSDDDNNNFESVEKRLIKLTDLKLHPLYKRNLSIPKRTINCTNNNLINYKTRSGPINNLNEIPKQLKIDLNLLNKKNLFIDLKRIEPPRQLLSKLIEINQNRRPTLEKKKQQQQQNTTNNNNNCNLQN